MTAKEYLDGLERSKRQREVSITKAENEYKENCERLLETYKESFPIKVGDKIRVKASDTERKVTAIEFHSHVKTITPVPFITTEFGAVLITEIRDCNGKAFNYREWIADKTDYEN